MLRPERFAVGYHIVSKSSRNHRQSATFGSNIKSGTAITPVRCATDVSTVTTRSDCPISAAVRAKPEIFDSKLCKRPCSAGPLISAPPDSIRNDTKLIRDNISIIGRKGSRAIDRSLSLAWFLRSFQATPILLLQKALIAFAIFRGLSAALSYTVSRKTSSRVGSLDDIAGSSS